MDVPERRGGDEGNDLEVGVATRARVTSAPLDVELRGGVSTVVQLVRPAESDLACRVSSRRQVAWHSWREVDRGPFRVRAVLDREHGKPVAGAPSREGGRVRGERGHQSIIRYPEGVHPPDFVAVLDFGTQLPGYRRERCRWIKRCTPPVRCYHSRSAKRPTREPCWRRGSGLERGRKRRDLREVRNTVRQVRRRSAQAKEARGAG